MDDIGYWLAWLKVPGVGAARVRALRDAFGDLALAWEAGPAELGKVLGPEVARRAIAGRRGLSPAREGEPALAALQGAGAWAIGWGDPAYPWWLARIHDPPPLFYGRGTLPDFTKAAAVVGTRRATEYGHRCARALAASLARRGVVVVSGLAMGIDADAHQGALDGGGPTVAVLGSGVDQPTPRCNLDLARRIVAGGALLSEYPPGTEALAKHFPERNRIVSGLCQAVVVIEAAARSGALITARLAAEQDRDVYALPGQVGVPQSEGPNALIADGARPVLRWTDVGWDLDWGPEVDPRPGPAGDTEARVLLALGLSPSAPEVLAARTGLDGAEVARILLMLELKALARAVPGGRYVRA